VTSGVKPRVARFQLPHPSIKELEHDFSWNATRRLPERAILALSNKDLPAQVIDQKHSCGTAIVPS
jgi:polyphosphate kinase 2 (PPK2 family)